MGIKPEKKKKDAVFLRLIEKTQERNLFVCVYDYLSD